jgi:methionine sulfoxide reductase heme-binding subunit
MSAPPRRPPPPLALAVWVGALGPLGVLGLQWWQGELGANPVSEVLNQLGLLGLVALLATLACTPLQRFAGWTWPARVRKHLGLVAFTYASLHLLTWAVVDQGLALGPIATDVAKRPFVTVGFTAWVLLVPLALTSTASSVRRLGFVRWKRLHRLVYVCAVLGVVHFTWKQKKEVREPVAYAVVLAALLASRTARRAPAARGASTRA